MTEAERAFAALHLRARVVLTIAFLIFAGVAREDEAVGPEISVRALAVGVARARGRRRPHGQAVRAGADVPGAVGSDAHRVADLGRAWLECPDFSGPDDFLDALRAGPIHSVNGGWWPCWLPRRGVRQ